MQLGGDVLVRGGGVGWSQYWKSISIIAKLLTPGERPP